MMTFIQESWTTVSDILCKYVPEQLLVYLPESVITRALLIGGSTGLLSYLLFRKRYHLPPGPFALPFIGNLFFFGKENLAKKLFKLSEKYGPVFTCYMGPKVCIVLNDIESVNEALLKKGAQYADRFTFYTADKMFYNSEDIIFGKYGTGWKLRRKVASRALRLFMTNGGFNEKVEAAVSRTVNQMLKENGAFDPKPYLLYTTLNIIAAMCFGKSYDYDDPDYWNLLNIFEDLGKITGDGLIFENVISIFAGIYTTTKYRKLEVVIQKFEAFIQAKIDAHKKTFVPGTVTDFTDSMLQAEIEIAAEGQDNMEVFKPVHVYLTIMNIFFAGNDTSRGTLHWALMYIIGVPGIQQKIQAEVDSAIGKDRYPTTDDRERLNYVDAVLHESMRMGLVVPIGVPHTTTCDTTIGKYEVPKGTGIIINHWALHNNPKNWNECNQFLPERFLDKDGKMAPKPENWLPFSAGRRVCLGEPLAKPELHLILAALFQQLEFSPEPGKTIDLTQVEKNTSFLPKPFKLVCKKRV